MLKKAATSLAMPAAHAFGADCALCGKAVREGLVCAACCEGMPRTGVACPRCALPLETPGICGRCLRDAPAFDAAIAVFEYGFPVDRLVQRFKYSGDLTIGRWLALELAAHIAKVARPDLLIAPPLTASRLAQRGFNQALEIAKVVAGRLQIGYSLNGMVRTHESAPQAGLTRQQRRANLRGAFRCDEPVEGLHVIVVDDVMTTGATVDAMARVLKAAGAARVDAWCIARTPEPGRT